MKVRTSWIGLFVACSIGVCGGAAAAQPAAPPAGYKIEEKYTQKWPDGTIKIAQYLNKYTDDWKWQFWVRQDGTFTLLDPQPRTGISSSAFRGTPTSRPASPCRPTS
jgi:hypothetical protein